MGLIYFAAALGVILIGYEIIHGLSGDGRRILRWFRLRRRGHRFESFILSIRLAGPKLLCYLGRHKYTLQQQFLAEHSPGYELHCERWFCPEFHRASRP